MTTDTGQTCTRFTKTGRRCRRPIADWPTKEGHPKPTEACWLHLSEAERLACIAAGGETGPAEVAQPITDPTVLLTAPPWLELALHVACIACQASAGESCTRPTMCPSRPAQIPTPSPPVCNEDECDQPCVEHPDEYNPHCWKHVERWEQRRVRSERWGGTIRADRRPFLADIDNAIQFWCPTCGKAPEESCVPDDDANALMPHLARAEQAAAHRRARNDLLKPRSQSKTR